MPATVVLEHHKPLKHPEIEHATSREHFLEKSCPQEFSPGQTRVVTSSFFVMNDQEKLYPSSSSLVRSVIEAWARHSHVVLRPDDFWLQILVQMNFFMLKNGESLRDLFVSHQGQEEIQIIDDCWETILGRFEQELHEKVKTPWLVEWVHPGFSTSTFADDLAAIVLMMGLMSTFFEYAAEDICGIPSITLLGDKADWERLLKKIDRLTDFGEEPMCYERRLRPILTRIVKTFDEPSSRKTKDFWDQLVHAKVKHDNTCGRPPLQYTVSGWVLGFFYWDSTGSVSKRFAQGLNESFRPGAIVLDGIHYGEEHLENLPVGYAKVTLKETKKEGLPNEKRWKCWLVAGSIGKRILDGAPKGYFAAVGQASVADAAQDAPADVPGGRGDPPRRKNRTPSILSRLCCAGEDEAEATPPSRPIEEKGRLQTSPAVIEQSQARKYHSTIQPCTGWALFGPQTELGPFIDYEEIDGPTVDAIDSCEGIEHYGNAAHLRRPKRAAGDAGNGSYILPPIKV